MQVDLRLADRSDVAAIHRIMVAAGAAVADERMYYVDDIDFVEDHIEDQGFTIVALLDSKIIGFQIVRIPGNRDDNLGSELGLADTDLEVVAHIESAAVFPEHWGKGIQRLLVTRAEALLAQRGFHWLMCTVHPENVHSLRNLRALGYRVVATKVKYGGFERHIMVKESSRGRPQACGAEGPR